MKCAMGLMVFVFSSLILGFTSFSAGQSATARTLAANTGNADLQKGTTAYAGGAGFASFCFIIAFLLLFSAACYYTPLLGRGGSPNEKRILRSPFDIEQEAASASTPTPEPEES